MSKQKNAQKITYRRQIITPEQAVQYLENGVENRPIRAEDVNKYALDMQEGRWRLNGETIKFTDQGKLFDGQNRLYAVIKANVSIEFEIMEGYDHAVINTVDSGRSRAPADVLAINGIKNGQHLSEAIKRIYGYQQDTTTRSSARSRIKLSNEYMLKFVQENPAIAEMAGDPLIGKSAKLTSSTLVIAFWFLFSKRNKAKAREFMEKLITGTGLDQGDPILMFRQLLIDRKMSVKKNEFLSIGDIYGLYIKTWNLWRRGEKVTKLSMKKNEPFQRIK